MLRLLIPVLGIVLWQVTCKTPSQLNDHPQQAVYRYVTHQADTLLSELDTLAALISRAAPMPEIQRAFAANRYRYKTIESLVEYYFQGLSKRINGPALPDIKTEDGQVWPPQGYQVIEQYLYGEYSKEMQASLVNTIRVLQTDLRFVKSNLAYNTLLPHHLHDALQHQFIRVAALGISGFDAPLSKLSLAEAAYSLQGIETIASAYQLPANSQRTQLLEQAMEQLHQGGFDSFDRLHFLRRYLMPLSQYYTAIPGYSPTADSAVAKPFTPTLTHFLTGQAFNADFYNSYDIGQSNPQKIALGRMLFFEKSLSRSGTMSCGTCHIPEKGFTDGLTKANNFIHGGSLSRNTPTLYYAALQSHQFYDMRSTSLEDQAAAVMNNTEEFNLPGDEAAKKILGNSEYKRLFDVAFAGAATRNTGYEIRNAIAAYIRSLSPFSSAFDRYMQGDTSALQKQQQQGFNLFAGKAKCATCHFIPLFNGNIPPWLTKSESEVIGVPEKPVWENAKIDPDSGRFVINKLEPLLYAFKTPTVRNVANTGPYMHNGVYKTLDEVVEFYHRGGGVGIGITLPNQSLPFDSLILSSAEKQALVAFMQSLTDEKRK